MPGIQILLMRNQKRKYSGRGPGILCGWRAFKGSKVQEFKGASAICCNSMLVAIKGGWGADGVKRILGDGDVGRQGIKVVSKGSCSFVGDGWD
jgi:hypothetical protein